MLWAIFFFKIKCYYEFMNDERITYIETKLAYLEDFLNQLQEVTVEHGKIIDKLVSENKAMSIKIKELSDNQEGEIPNVRPPHY